LTDPVPLVFTVTNPGTSSLTLQLLGRTPTADFQVSDPDGRRIWSLLGGKTLVSVLQLFPLDGGKILSFRRVWNQHTDAGLAVTPGEYLIRGVLLTDAPEGMASPPTQVTIEG
jgi:hypothetical protein